MQIVYRSTLINDARIVKSILDSEGIPCMLKNDILQTLSGEVPFVSAWPEVWVGNDSDVERAKKLIETMDKPVKASDWVCPQCGEKIEGEFDACWNCGTLRDETEQAGGEAGT